MANCNQPLTDILELLRKKQGNGQVTKQENGQNQGSRGDKVDLHGLPQLLACLDVQERQGEENYRVEQHRQILHRGSRISRRIAPVSLRREAPEETRSEE